MIELTKPLAFFDLETTGLNVAEDRIVSIAIHKINIDGTEDIKYKLVNPTIPIPKGSMEVHGITDEMVKDEPTFKQMAKGMMAFLEGCDLGGYNAINYDLPLLSEEFARCNIMYPPLDLKIVDAGRIFHLQEPRTLEAALKKYCGKTLENSHNAAADTQATVDVFLAQLEVYKGDIGESIIDIHSYCQGNDTRADLSNKIIIENGDYYFNFGKEKGKKVVDAVGFANWMLDKDFTYNTKLVIKKVLEDAGIKVKPIKLPI